MCSSDLAGAAAQEPEYLRGLAAGRGMRGTGGKILPVGEKYPAYREGYEM